MRCVGEVFFPSNKNWWPKALCGSASSLMCNHFFLFPLEWLHEQLFFFFVIWFTNSPWPCTKVQSRERFLYFKSIFFTVHSVFLIFFISTHKIMFCSCSGDVFFYSFCCPQVTAFIRMAGIVGQSEVPASLTLPFSPHYVHLTAADESLRYLFLLRRKR